MTMLLMLPMYAVVVSTVLLRSVEELCDPTIIVSIISWRLLTSSLKAANFFSHPACMHVARTGALLSPLSNSSHLNLTTQQYHAPTAGVTFTLARTICISLPRSITIALSMLPSSLCRSMGPGLSSTSPAGSQPDVCAKSFRTAVDPKYG